MLTIDLTVVLTATIRTTVPVARADPALRLADYRRGLRFWLELPDPRIRRLLFIDNSDHPLDQLETDAAAYNPHDRECEFVSLDCNVLPPNLHYGYTEFQLLDLGLAQSRSYGRSRAFLKATGRYTFPTVSRLLDRLPDNCVFAGDSRNNLRFERQPRRFTNCALLYFTRDFYDRHLRSLYRQMRPAPPWTREQFIEDVMFDQLMPLRGEPGVVLRWPVNCEPSGIGANDDNYDTPRKKLQRGLRALGRRFTPHWWF